MIITTTKQASERYYTLTGVATTVTLTTRDGAHLNPADIINDVIDNNEEVCGEILGLKFPPLSEQYAKKCQLKGIGKRLFCCLCNRTTLRFDFLHSFMICA